MDTPTNMTANERATRTIKALMGANDTSQEELASNVGMHQTSLSKRLRNLKGWTLNELEAIARYYDVGTADLLDGDIRTGSFATLDLALAS